jgi:hypothetical protein
MANEDEQTEAVEAAQREKRAMVAALVEKMSSEFSSSADSLQQAVRELLSRDDDYALRIRQLGEIRQMLGLSLRDSHQQVILSIAKLGLAGSSIAAHVDLSAVPERYRWAVEWEKKQYATREPVAVMPAPAPAPEAGGGEGERSDK